MIISLLRKPQANTITALPCGAINIDACRVGEKGGTRDVQKPGTRVMSVYGHYGSGTTESLGLGRFPANLILILSDAILSQFPYTESGKAAPGGHVRNTDKSRGCYGKFVGQRVEGSVLYGDAGSSARFFKAVAQ